MTSARMVNRLLWATTWELTTSTCHEVRTESELRDMMWGETMLLGWQESSKGLANKAAMFQSVERKSREELEIMQLTAGVTEFVAWTKMWW